MAEYYHVHNWRGLPLKTAAILACGLPGRSRTMMKLSGQRITTEEALLALAVDRLSVLVWQNTEDGIKGRNAPKSVYSVLTHEKEGRQGGISFETAEEFEEARARIMERSNGNDNRNGICSDSSDN